MSPEQSLALSQWFLIPSPEKKLALLTDVVETSLLLLADSEQIRGLQVGRNLQILFPWELPAKPGLSSLLGQGRLLHDLANIELQAMELAVRTLVEFPAAPPQFRYELAEIARSEGRHLALCLGELTRLGFKWGDWPAHLALWQVVSEEDSLIDRVLIVHRYLEGSGLDAGASILRRLLGVSDKRVRRAVQTIVDEEVDHVAFGSRWYHELASSAGFDLDSDFATRMERISAMAPRRERLAYDLRRKAGFTTSELQTLQAIQDRPASTPG